MKTRKYIALSSSVVLATLIMTTLATPAARAADSDLRLIWSDTSEALNLSTEALKAGRTDEAARLAEAAMTEALSYGDRLIASHNLCVALAERDTAAAEPHCRAALDAPARMVVKPVGETLRIRAGRTTFVPSIGAQTLSSVMRGNIRQAFEHQIPQIADSKPNRN